MTQKFEISKHHYVTSLGGKAVTTITQNAFGETFTTLVVRKLPNGTVSIEIEEFKKNFATKKNGKRKMISMVIDQNQLNNIIEAL